MAKKSSNYKKIAINAVAVAGGQVAANAVDQYLVSKVSAKLPAAIQPYATPAVQIVGGVILADKFGKNEMVESAAVGMAAKGVLNLAKAILGSNAPSIIAGTDTMLAGTDYVVDATLLQDAPQMAGNAAANETPMLAGMSPAEHM